MFFPHQLIYRPISTSLEEVDYSSPAVINKTTLTNLRIRLLRLNVFPGDDLSDPNTALRFISMLLCNDAWTIVCCSGNGPWIKRLKYFLTKYLFYSHSLSASFLSLSFSLPPSPFSLPPPATSMQCTVLRWGGLASAMDTLSRANLHLTLSRPSLRWYYLYKIILFEHRRYFPLHTVDISFTKDTYYQKPLHGVE